MACAPDFEDTTESQCLYLKRRLSDAEDYIAHINDAVGAELLDLRAEADALRAQLQVLHEKYAILQQDSNHQLSQLEQMHIELEQARCSTRATDKVVLSAAQRAQHPTPQHSTNGAHIRLTYPSAKHNCAESVDQIAASVVSSMRPLLEQILQDQQQHDLRIQDELQIVAHHLETTLRAFHRLPPTFADAMAPMRDLEQPIRDFIANQQQWQRTQLEPHGQPDSTQSAIQKGNLVSTAHATCQCTPPNFYSFEDRKLWRTRHDKFCRTEKPYMMCSNRCMTPSVFYSFTEFLEWRQQHAPFCSLSP